MTQEVRYIIVSVFPQIWRLFTGFYIPGTNITPAMLIFFPAFVSLIMLFVRDLLRMNGPSNGDDIKKGK